MTEKAMKEMLVDIINNKAEYEVKKCSHECNANDDLYCDCEHKKWSPYKLGDKINFNWDYRKVEYFYVVETFKGYHYLISNYADNGKFAFKSRSKQECKDWISNHQPTWFENWQHRMSTKAFEFNALQGSYLGIVSFAKKLLEVTKDCPVIDLELILKDLGVPSQFSMNI